MLTHPWDGALDDEAERGGPADVAARAHLLRRTPPSG